MGTRKGNAPQVYLCQMPVSVKGTGAVVRHGLFLYVSAIFSLWFGTQAVDIVEAEPLQLETMLEEEEGEMSIARTAAFLQCATLAL